MAKRVSRFQQPTQSKTKDHQPQGVRMDKWLWAARFFKTRSIAKTAIEGGKVHLNGDKVKVSREVQIGMQLTIQQGIEKKTVIVKALSDVRGSAPIAQQLYEETAESLAKRELQAEQRKMMNIMYSSHRPSKKDRRDLGKFHQQYDFADNGNAWSDDDVDDLDNFDDTAYADDDDDFDE